MNLLIQNIRDFRPTVVSIIASQSAVLREPSAARLDPSLQNGPPDRSALRSGPFGFDSPLIKLQITIETRMGLYCYWYSIGESNP